MKATASQSRWRATSSRVRPITSRNHGPVHKVEMPICTPEVRPKSGARRQNTGVRMIDSICPNWRRSGAGSTKVSARGAAAKTSTAETRMTAAKTPKAPRHPMRPTRYSVGSLATTMPSAPTDITAVLASERRSAGTQVAVDL